MKKELDCLEQGRVIKSINHSGWVAPIVMVPKGDGRVRICWNYKVTAKDMLEVDQYTLP